MNLAILLPRAIFALMPQPDPSGEELHDLAEIVAGQPLKIPATEAAAIMRSRLARLQADLAGAERDANADHAFELMGEIRDTEARILEYDLLARSAN